VRRGLVACDPIVYEDFLPISAAGIFRSNLGDRENPTVRSAANLDLFERQLGCSVIDEHDLYASIERGSLENVRMHFNVAT
jgi:uncharacterized glyoxalase superfamily metalloenzyme YdcJ